MSDQTMTETETPATPATPAKLSGFSTAKTQQAGRLVTLARCDWAALHFGDNSLPSNPTSIASFMQGKAAAGVSVVAWLQGPAVIIEGHDSKSATAALLAVVNAYTTALALAAQEQERRDEDARARQAALEAGEAAAEAAAVEARTATGKASKPRR